MKIGEEKIQATLHTPNNTQNDAEVAVCSIVKSFFFSFYYHIHIHPKMDSPVFPLTLAFIVITYLIKVISERITFFFKSNVKYLVLDFLGKIILIAKIFETKRECNNFGFCFGNVFGLGTNISHNLLFVIKFYY